MRIKKFDEYINETAVSLDDIFTEETDTGIVRVLTKKSLRIVIYNFKERVVEGYIDLDKFKGDKEFMVSRSYAIDKHGPACYELALSILSPEGILPDRTIRPGAQRVWNYFDKNRSDVRKTPIKPDHDWYARTYSLDADHEGLKDPDVLDMLNKVYSLDKPIKYSEELIERGEAMLKKYHMTPHDVLKLADMHFWEKYNADFK
jgi:hypothetical protein